MRLLQEIIEPQNGKINKIEKLKIPSPPALAFGRIAEYAKTGYEAITQEDKEFFLRCFGVYDRPTSPGSFMLRLRIPGGRLQGSQAMAIACLAKRYTKGSIDLTTRMGMELRDLKPSNLPSIMDDLESVGITTWQTGSDNFRNITTDPLDGLAKDSIIQTAKIIEALEALFMKNARWIGTIPRKFNTSICGSMINRCNLFGNDCAFALAKKEGRYGFNVYLGGKAYHLAQSADIFLTTSEEVVLFFGALMEVYQKYGFRDHRHKNRLFHLIEKAGLPSVVSAVCEAANRTFESAGQSCIQECGPSDNPLLLKDGTYALELAVVGGELNAKMLQGIAEAADKYATGELRLGTNQNITIVGIPEKNIPPLGQDPRIRPFLPKSPNYFQNLISCVGSERCIYAMIPGKSDALEMATFLEKEVPLDTPVRLYWSACHKGCGLNWAGDIGLEGSRTKMYGKAERSLNIFIGGTVDGSQKISREVARCIPIRHVRYYLLALLAEFKRLKKPNETFTEFNGRVLEKYSASAIGFFMHMNFLLGQKLKSAQRLRLDPLISPFEEQTEIIFFGEQLAKIIPHESKIRRIADGMQKGEYSHFYDIMSILVREANNGF